MKCATIILIYFSYLLYVYTLLFILIIYFMKTYNKIWTKFETHALAFSLLRKHLYPNYWVRGDYKLGTLQGDIVLFKPSYGEPVLKLIIQVEASNAGHTKSWENSVDLVGKYDGVQILKITGGEAAYNIRNIVTPYL